MDSLNEAVQFVNDGFEAGHVTKTDLATYLFSNALRFLSKTEVSKIRDQFFDEETALKELVKSVSTSGGLPSEFTQLLKERFKSSSESKKKAPKEKLDPIEP